MVAFHRKRDVTVNKNYTTKLKTIFGSYFALQNFHSVSKRLAIIL